MGLSPSAQVHHSDPEGAGRFVLRFGGAPWSHPVQQSGRGLVMVAVPAWDQHSAKQLQAKAGLFIIYMLLTQRQGLCY